MSEADIQNAIRLAVGSLPYVRLWRNNVGMLKDHRGVPIRYGLAPGSADLIGVVAPSGRMLSIEVKAPGRLRTATEAQVNWARMVEQFGGVAGIVDNVADALALAERARVTG